MTMPACLCAGALLVTFVQFVRFPAPGVLLVSGRGHDTSYLSFSNFSGQAEVLSRSHKPPSISEAFLYDDESYIRGRGGSRAFAASFAAHFADETKRRQNMPVNLRVVDADELRKLLSGGTSGKALLILEGFLPDTVRGPHFDLLKRWLRSGGLVFWAGAPFDAYYSTRTSPRGPGHVVGPDYEPWRKLYGPGSLAAFAKVSDPWSPPLGVGTSIAQYWSVNRLDFSRTTFPVKVGALEADGGTPLGFVSEQGFSSISQLPIGKGRLVVFGDAAWNEIDAAHAVVQILYTGSWYEPRDIRSSVVEVGRVPRLYAVRDRHGSQVQVYATSPDLYDLGSVSL